MNRVLPPAPVEDLAQYLTSGGGAAIDRARRIGPEAVIAEIRRSGLRGRGGAGFPTGIKWRGVAAADGPKALVCNAAEGEPGTIKDRVIIGYDPFRVIEGLVVGGIAVGASRLYVGIKRRFAEQVARLRQAADSMTDAGLLDGFELHIVEGPDDYLFGVETAMLEVIEGRDPLPRVVPPYVRGVVDEAGVEAATAVNNVETLANVPGIVVNGADWFGSIGTEDSPGTVICTVSGDVRTAAVTELAMGTPLSILVYGVGEGLEAGRQPKLVVSGVSNQPLGAADLDTPMSFEGMAAAGSGLGSSGFIVYDDTTCVAEVGAALSGYLQRGSCGQCPPCKLGTTVFAEGFAAVVEGTGDSDLLEEMTAWLVRVTDANRCGLGAAQRGLAAGILTRFWDDVVACLEGACPGHRGLLPPSPLDHDPSADRPVVRVVV